MNPTQFDYTRKMSDETAFDCSDLYNWHSCARIMLKRACRVAGLNPEIRFAGDIIKRPDMPTGACHIGTVFYAPGAGPELGQTSLVNSLFTVKAYPNGVIWVEVISHGVGIRRFWPLHYLNKAETMALELLKIAADPDGYESPEPLAVPYLGEIDWANLQENQRTEKTYFTLP